MLQHSNLVRLVDITKDSYRWPYHHCVVTYVQFLEQPQNEDQIWNMPPKTCTARRRSFSSTVNTSYYISFIKLLMLSFIINPLHRPDDMWLLTACFTSIFPSCSVAHHIAACIFPSCLNVCLCLSWQHSFSTKLNRIYGRDFSSVSEKQVRSNKSDLGLPHFNWQYIEQTWKKSSPVLPRNGWEEKIVLWATRLFNSASVLLNFFKILSLN